MRAFLIFAAIVIALAGLAIYFFWYVPTHAAGDQNIPAPGDPGNPNNDQAEEAPPLSQVSTKANINEIGIAPDPAYFLAHVLQGQMNMYNLLSAPGMNPAHIHFETGIANICPPYIWYRNWLYFKASEKTEAAIKTCYYTVASAQLPAEIKIYLSALNTKCDSQSFYLSGKRYQVMGAVQTISNQKFCTYKKQ